MKVCVVGYGNLAKITKELLQNIDTPTCDIADAPDIVWCCDDVTLVTADQAVYEIGLYVEASTTSLFLISSQLPVGTIRELEGEYPGTRFACCPENFKAIDGYSAYFKQARFVVGTRSKYPELIKLFAFTEEWGIPILWVSIESAEMIKHTINAYLGMCIAFINEIGDICKAAGADVKEVEQGLLSDSRVSPSAPLKAGGPFQSGHIERDLDYLAKIHATPLISAITISNEDRR